MGGLMGLIQGLRGVIGPSMPKTRTLIVLVVGFLIGLMWAYVISPTVYYDADPSTLRQEFQDNWVKNLAWRNYTANSDVDGYISQMLLYVDDPAGIVNRLLNTPEEAENHEALQSIQGLATNVQPNAVTAPQPSLIGSLVPFILGPILLVLLTSILVVVWNLLLYPFMEPTLAKAGIGRRSGPGIVGDDAAKAVTESIKDVKKAESLKVDYTTTMGKPVIQKMSIYQLGRGQYDDSFSIEDENDRFLGECGAGISETIGGGSPAKVSAVEVWLFDKDDFVRTMTLVFASPHAYNDPAIRSRLEEKGEVFLVTPGATASLETSMLRLQARVVDVQFGTGDAPPDSFFDRLTMEIAVWQKQPGSGNLPMAAPPVAAPTYAAPAAGGYSAPAVQAAPPSQFAPPPVQPRPPIQPMQQSAPPPLPPRPAAPPPTPPRHDDDPFGGTGDFTPIT